MELQFGMRKKDDREKNWQKKKIASRRGRTIDDDCLRFWNKKLMPEFYFSQNTRSMMPQLFFLFCFA